MENSAQASPPKVIVTGTGKAGTRLLVRLLTELGLEDCAARTDWRIEYYEHGTLGLEKKPFGPGGAEPEPALPARATDEAERQQIELTVQFHEWMHTLVRCEIPFTLLEFPRFGQDPRYAFQRLELILQGRSWEDFEAAFRRVVDPALVEATSGEYATIARGLPALAYATSRRQARRQLLQRAAVGALLAAVIGFGAYRLSRTATPVASTRSLSSLVQDDETSATNPEALPEERSSSN